MRGAIGNRRRWCSAPQNSPARVPAWSRYRRTGLRRPFLHTAPAAAIRGAEPMNQELIDANRSRAFSPAPGPASRAGATCLAHPARPVLDWLDRRLLDAYQRDFPICETPFAEIARRLHRRASEVLRRFTVLERRGVVSRARDLRCAHEARAHLPSETLVAVAGGKHVNDPADLSPASTKRRPGVPETRNGQCRETTPVRAAGDAVPRRSGA